MSQQALAEAMRARGWKWSQATVWSIEKGERPLKLAEASDLSNMLNVGVSHFLAPQHEQMRLNNAWTHARGVSESVATLWQSLENLAGHHAQLLTYIQLIEAIPLKRWEEIGLGGEVKTLLDTARSLAKHTAAEHVQRALDEFGYLNGKHSEEA